MFRVKRVFEPPPAADGFRVLIDRLWPRRLNKSDAALGEWLKAVAPSTELRVWSGHDSNRWAEFQRRYRIELAAPERVQALARLRALERAHGTVTLLFAARDVEHHHGIVLLEALNAGGG